MSSARSEIAELTPNATDLRAPMYTEAASGQNTVDRARTILGLTQSEIADALRANESTLHRWRTGESRPTAVYATRLAALNDLIDAIQLLARTPSEMARWLNTPDAAFGGRTPRHLIRDGRCEFVLGALAVRAERPVSPGALYTALQRLEAKGVITSRMGDPTPQRGGRAKRHVAVTAPGMRALRRSLQAYQRLLDGLDLFRGAHA